MQYLVSPMSEENDKPIPTLNPHSGTGYKSLQLTCRQMIHRHDPFLDWRDDLLEIMRNLNLSSKSRQVVKEILMLSQNTNEQNHHTKSNFFPFEVHILDESTALQNKIGDANHERYKKAQIRTARKRILYKVFALSHPNQKSFVS